MVVIAADINHANPDRVNDEDRDPCISDPEETKTNIEKSGFKFEKREDVTQSKEVDYILIFKASEPVLDPLLYFSAQFFSHMLLHLISSSL